MPKYRFMSFNVRTQTPVDGENQFNNRVGFLCGIINEYKPDIIGLQELKPDMRIKMARLLPDYYIIGGGRDDKRLDESPAIAFLKDKFMVERLSTDILSYTPHIPGSTYGGDQSVCPRAFCSADLMPLEGGTPIRFMNIHTDHAGEKARQLEVAQLLIKLSQENALRDMPTVITGDFNALPDSPEMQQMYAYGDMKLTDATQSIAGTFHGFGTVSPMWKIDYIWLSERWQIRSVTSLHQRRGELYLSDHDPVLADAELK